jgi:MarR family transcriptional regulator, organic hydroperoxide resistance regulator
MSTRPATKAGNHPATARASRRRSELLAQLQRAAQTSTTDGILFHQAVADRVGLHVTDLRCLNLLANAGPLTAGELGQRLGLGTTGAVTRMVDRLERAGYVRREADPRDRRRVIIQPVPEQLAAIAPHYQGMATAWNELLAAYSDEQLHLFLDLFDRLHQMSQQQLASLDHGTPGSDIATS